MLAQTDFEQIERHQREGRWDLVGELLAEQGNKLKVAGADFLPTTCSWISVDSQPSVAPASASPTAAPARQPTARSVSRSLI